MTQEVRVRLDHSARALVAEFPQLTPGEALRELTEAAESLLAGARFDDYVPVLAHRAARDRLRLRGPVPELAA